MKRSLLFYGKIAALLLLVIVLGSAAIGSGTAWYYIETLDMPDHQALAAASDKVVCEAEGKRGFVSLEAIPRIVKAASLAADDPEFYARSAVNPFTELAGMVLFDRKTATPGISIAVTRCLAFAWLDKQSKKSPSDWHLVNALLLYRIERDLSKDRIFEIYLNDVRMGAGVNGMAAAAEAYLRKQLPDLSVAEAAYLVAMPRSPSQFIRNKNYALTWRDRVLDRMSQAGAISAAEAEEAKKQPLPL
jgi:penicillin-binding protein 1A